MTPPESPPDGSPELRPEVEEFVRTFATALQQWVMYPEGHDILESTLRAVVESAEGVFQVEEQVELWLSQGTLHVQGTPLGHTNPTFDSLARRLHGEELRALTFRSGLSGDEVREVLDLLAEYASRDDALGAPGSRDLPERPHLSLEPFRYEGFRLDPRADAVSDEREPGGWSETDLVERNAGELAGQLAESLAGPDRESAEAVRELVGLVDAAKQTGGEQLEELRRKMSSVILELDAESLEKLTEHARANGDEARLLRAAADGLDLEAVRRLVTAAAEGRNQDIADWLLRLLAKLSQYGGSDDADSDSARREDVRETVDRILENWDLEDPRPQPYTDQLDDLARRRPEESEPTEQRTLEVEPERLLSMGLEMDEPAPPVEEASQQLVDAERFSELSSFLHRSPGDNEVGKLLWSQLSVPRVVKQLLEAEPGQRELLDRLVLQSGTDVAPPLLDALSVPKARERTFRDRVIDLLCQIGEPVASLVPERLESPEPFVRRNLLRLLTALAVLPPNFSPIDYMEDPDPGVRLQAFQITCQEEENRPEAIRRALEDDHLKLVSLALQEAEASFPPSAEELVVRHLHNDDLPESVRIHAVRALGAHGTDRGLEALVELVWLKRWYFWRRLARPSPIVLEALQAIARRWADDPRAREPLEAARSSRDPEVRKAVTEADREEE